MFLHMHLFITIISLVCTTKSRLLGLWEILGTVVFCFVGFPVFFLQKKELFYLHFFSVGLFSSGSTRSFTCILTWTVTSDLRLKVKTDSFPPQPSLSVGDFVFYFPEKEKQWYISWVNTQLAIGKSLSLSTLSMSSEWLLWARHCSSTWI